MAKVKKRTGPSAFADLDSGALSILSDNVQDVLGIGSLPEPTAKECVYIKRVSKAFQEALQASVWPSKKAICLVRKPPQVKGAKMITTIDTDSYIDILEGYWTVEQVVLYHPTIEGLFKVLNIDPKYIQKDVKVLKFTRRNKNQFRFNVEYQFVGECGE